MKPSRVLTLAAAGSAVLYLLFYYVPISAGHTVEIFPLRPLGDWSIESATGLALFYAGILAALFGLYAWAAKRAREEKGGRGNARLIVYLGAAAAILVLTFAPSLLSKDLFDYMVHGRILAVHGANPFASPADAFPPDEFLRAMGWPEYTAIYGPCWISACAFMAWISPFGVTGTAVLYKILLGGLHLLTGLLVGALLKGWGKPSLRGELLYLWNPLVLLQVAGQAHNDGFMVFWILLALYLSQRRSRTAAFYDEALSVVSMTVSVLVKYVSAPLLALLLAARWRERGGLPGFLRAGLLLMVAGLVIVAGYLPYAAEMDMLHFLRPYEHAAYSASPLEVMEMGLKKMMPPNERGTYPDRVGDILLATSASLAGLLAVWGLILLFRLRKDEDVPRYGLYVLLAYLLVAAAMFRVSYGIWLVALAVIVPPGLARRASFVASATFLAQEIYWVYGIRAFHEGIPLHRQRVLATLVAVGVPGAYLLAGLLRRRPERAA